MIQDLEKQKTKKREKNLKGKTASWRNWNLGY